MLAKTQQTAIGAAFSLRGITPARAEFMIALAKFRNNGGTYADVISCADMAYADELSGKGQRSVASNGQTDIAQPRQANEDEAGHKLYAGIGHLGDAPSSSPNRGGEGHCVVASKGLTRAALPAREPSPEQRAASARVEAASARAAMTILDRMKTSDGKAWGDVGEHELIGMQRDGTMAKAIDDWMGPRSDKQRFKPVRELMNDKQFELVLARVKGQNHAA